MVKLSIIIPYYKTYELTCKIIQTLIPQLNEKVEVILIDDGCNEKRLDQFDKDINIIHSKQNVGGGETCNKGIEVSKGDYIAFIDSDDMISDDYVETLLKTIDEQNKDVIFFDWQDINTGNIVHHPDNYAPWKCIYKRTIIPRFEPDIKYSYDVPFYNKLNSNPYSRYYIDKVLYFYNSNRPGNLTLEKERMRKQNMIKLKAIETFTLVKFDQLYDIERVGGSVQGKIFKGDVFKCDKEMADYLLGNNPKNFVAALLMEMDPEPTTEQIDEQPKKEKKKKSYYKSKK